MSLFHRIFRIGKANINAALESLEDPIKIIDQLLRELDNDIEQVTAAVTMQIAVEKRFEREWKESADLVERRNQQARKALEMGDDDLAREALTDKNRQMQRYTQLKDSYDTAKEDADRLREQLQDMKDRVQSMRAQRSTLIAQAEAAKTSVKISQTMSGINDSGVSSSFARMEQKVQLLNDQAAAVQNKVDQSKSIDDIFEELERASAKLEIEDELAALKAEIKKS